MRRAGRRRSDCRRGSAGWLRGGMFHGQNIYALLPRYSGDRGSVMALRAAQRPARVAVDGRSPSYWLILGLVMEEPSHGYEISRRYKSRFGELVPLTVPRVYAALDRLREDGLIELLALDESADVPKQHLMRRSYRASPGGTEAYRDWLVEQLREDPLRAQLLTRIASVAVMGIEATLEVIDRYAQVCLEQLRALDRKQVA